MKLTKTYGLSTIFLLTFIAGYCDSVTLFSSGFLSVHVFGNIILAACQFFDGNLNIAFTQLITIPIYAASILAVQSITYRNQANFNPIRVSGLSLTLIGLFAFLTENFLDAADSVGGQILCFMVIFVVSFLRYTSFRRIKYNVIFNSSQTTRAGKLYTHRMFFSALAFLTGCLFGGVTGHLFGLSAIALAGIILFLATIND